MKKNQRPSLIGQAPRIFGCLFLAVLASLSSAWAAGGIATDGSVGPQQVLSGTHVTVAQGLGTTVGNNLFHSFAEFNIHKGQTVTFTGSDALANVISRVTGNDPSAIDGTLRSAIPHANFYLINPNGITFGQGAQVDVPGAFHAGTADKIDFANNSGVFYAERNQASTLSSEAPAAFGFLGTSAANNGLIDVDHAKLAVAEGQTLDMVAGEITLENQAKLAATAGEIRLAALQGAGSASLQRTAEGILPLPAAAPSAANAGNIGINAGKIDASGDGGGRISLWGGHISFSDGKAYADNEGTTDASPSKGVAIRSDFMSLDNSWVSSDSLDTGKAGNVDVTTHHLTLNGGIYASFISSDAYGKGLAGIVTVDADTLNIRNQAWISSDTYGQGHAGSVVVTADTLSIDGLGFETGISSAAREGSSGHAGDVEVHAGQLSLANAGTIQSDTAGSGHAGNVIVEADNLSIKGGTDFNGDAALSYISSDAVGEGDAGNVSVTANNLVVHPRGWISSDTYQSGRGGDVLVSADTLSINGGKFGAGISSVAFAGSTRRAGNVEVNAETLNITNGGSISSDTAGSGAAGNVIVAADEITLDGGATLSFISSDAVGTGTAGTVTVNAVNLAIRNGGWISSDAYHEGNGNNVSVTAETLTIDGAGYGTGISSETLADSSGNAGNVEVTVGALRIENQGSINSDTQGSGKAGSVTVAAGTMEILHGGAISSASMGDASSGKTGDVEVTASQWLHLADGGRISIENQAILADGDVAMAITPGTITVTAADIAMHNSSITTNSLGNVSAGHIIVDFSHWLTLDPSFITTTANTGNGGAITIGGGELAYLQDSGLVTTVSGAQSNGGDIAVAADILVMDTGQIQANAVGGSGGNINLSLEALIPSSSMLSLRGAAISWQPFSGLNVIQAASQTGISGTVSVTIPQLNLSGVLANMGGPQFDSSAIGQDYCDLGAGSSLTRKDNGGVLPDTVDLLKI